MAMWLWMWILFMLVLFVVPLAYGWAYRGWGPPRRRRPSGVAEGGPEASDWGWLATFLWLVLLIGLVWLVLALVYF